MRSFTIGFWLAKSEWCSARRSLGEGVNGAPLTVALAEVRIVNGE